MSVNKYSIAIALLIVMSACSKLPYDENPPLFEPSDLVYNEELITVAEYESFSTQVPSVIGTGPLTFELENNHGYFQINAENGRVSLPKDHQLATGSYSLSVKVNNPVVNAPVLFENVLTVEVTPFDASAYVPQDLAYESGLTWQSGAYAISPVPSIGGESPFTFSLEEAEVGFLIDEDNGRIYIEEGNTLLEGVYKLSVRVSNSYTEAAGVLFPEVFEIEISEEEIPEDVNLHPNEFCNFETLLPGDLDAEAIDYWDMEAWSITPQVVNDGANATQKALYVAGERTFQAFWNRNEPMQLEEGKTYELSVYMKGIKAEGANTIKVAMHFWNPTANATAKVEQKELTTSYQKYTIQWTCTATGSYLTRFNTLSVAEGCMSEFWFDEIFVKEVP